MIAIDVRYVPRTFHLLLSRVVVKHGLVDAQGTKLKDVEYTLPKWFEANKLYQHFNGKPMNFDD
ncbi:MAG: hypothetical protein ACKPFA_38585 [Dolichospermum sp.]